MPEHESNAGAETEGIEVNDGERITVDSGAAHIREANYSGGLGEPYVEIEYTSDYESIIPVVYEYNDDREDERHYLPSTTFRVDDSGSRIIRIYYENVFGNETFNRTSREEAIDRLRQEVGEEDSVIVTPTEDAIEYAISDSSLSDEDMEEALEEFRESDYGHEFESSFDESVVIDTSEDGNRRVWTYEDIVEDIELGEEMVNIHIDTEHEYIQESDDQENDEFTVELVYSTSEGTTTIECGYSYSSRSALPSVVFCHLDTLEQDIEESESMSADVNDYEWVSGDYTSTDESSASDDGYVGDDSSAEVVAEDEGLEPELATTSSSNDRYSISDADNEYEMRRVAEDIETRVDQLLQRRQRIIEELENGENTNDNRNAQTAL